MASCLPWWYPLARCRSADPGLFFGPEGECGADSVKRTEKAKAVCGECQVIVPCAEYAVTKPEQGGVWGGLSEDERRSERRRRTRRAVRGERERGEGEAVA